MANRVVWFDIPVRDLDRAIQFYSAVLGVKVARISHDTPVAVMQSEPNEVSGCLFESHGENPSDEGPLLYMNVDGRLDDAIAKAEANGGKVVKEKHSIMPHGWRALVRDSEGNRIALHSRTE